jgi:hypothetical protein
MTCRRSVEEGTDEKGRPGERWRDWQTTEQNGKTSHQPYAPKRATGDDDDDDD